MIIGSASQGYLGVFSISKGVENRILAFCCVGQSSLGRPLAERSDLHVARSRKIRQRVWRHQAQSEMD